MDGFLVRPGPTFQHGPVTLPGLDQRVRFLEEQLNRTVDVLSYPPPGVSQGFSDDSFNFMTEDFGQ